ncbi:MAG: UbiD family decarboxylase, partial [Thaumarchaeota archaeon]|nr:UbiD family decarboxylase [Nitrososphaerota archaeon]
MASRYRDLRGFLQLLEKEGELVRIKKKVETGEEIGAIMIELNERRGVDAPCVIFENVSNYKIPVVKNVLGSFKRIALAYGLPNWRRATRKEIVHFLARKMEDRKDWKKSKIVKGAPCKEVIITGKNVDLTKFPILKWHSPDGGPYITFGGVVMGDKDWGQNLGIYRMMLQNKNTTSMLVNLLQDSGKLVSRARERGSDEIDCAVALGFHPGLNIPAGIKMPSVARNAELEFAGALTGQPTELVKCETVDLYVPATAEIILEGKVTTKETMDEGPFCEWMGYAEEVSVLPVFKVKCITHRRNPLLQSCMSVHTYSETQVIQSLQGVSWYNQMRKAVVGFRDLNIVMESRCYLAVVQVRKRMPGWGKQALYTILSSGFAMATVNVVMVVDEDIDIYDWKDILFALGTRVDPDLDVVMFPPVATNALNPAARIRIPRDPSSLFTNFAMCSKMGIDATKKSASEVGRSR